VDRSRCGLVLGLGGLSVFSFSFSFAQARTPVPGGGSVVVPSPYKSKTDYPNYGNRAPRYRSSRIAGSFQA
jgi:hypothetical protein